MNNNARLLVNSERRGTPLMEHGTKQNSGAVLLDHGTSSGRWDIANSDSQMKPSLMSLIIFTYIVY